MFLDYPVGDLFHLRLLVAPCNLQFPTLVALAELPEALYRVSVCVLVIAAAMRYMLSTSNAMFHLINYWFMSLKKRKKKAF